MGRSPKLRVFCRWCSKKEEQHKKSRKKRKRPKLFSATRRQKDGVVTSRQLLRHLSDNDDCSYHYGYRLGGVKDFSSSVFDPEKFQARLGHKFCLTNTQNGPGSALPENLDSQVMFDPTCPRIDRDLLEDEIDNATSSFEPSSPFSVVDESEKTHDNVLDSNERHPPSNLNQPTSPRISTPPISTPNHHRHVSDELKVKIKLMKIMRNHNIPLAAERELYQWAAEAESQQLFSWSQGNLFKTRKSAMKELYKTAPEIEGGDFEPVVIDWRYKASFDPSHCGRKQIYVRSFRKALHSLLTNVTLVTECNLSFPNQNDPTSFERNPPLENDDIIRELHHGSWWIETWKRKCNPRNNEILVPIILYMDGIAIDNNGLTSLTPLNMTLGIFNDLTRSSRPDAWETIYFHPSGKRDKADESIDNVNNLHAGLRAALNSLKEACDSSEGLRWSNLPWNGRSWSVILKFAVAFFIGDTPQHDDLCGHYRSANTKMLCRHCNCPRPLGINARANVLKERILNDDGCFSFLPESGGLDAASSFGIVRFWTLNDFCPQVPGSQIRPSDYFQNISHHEIKGGNAFYDLDFGVNPYNIHFATPGERLHMHQLGCAKRAAETFREDFLGMNCWLLGSMDRVASYYGAVVQRQSNRDFPRTNFSESIHTAKKEGGQYLGMLYIQMLTLLSAEGRQALTSPRTPGNQENKNRKTEEEIDRRIYALELILGMEEFLKYSGSISEVMKVDAHNVTNLDKMAVLFVATLDLNLRRSKGDGNNLIKNHMYFHLSEYIRCFGPPSGWDSAPSESNHKTEVKAPAKRTQQVKDTLIKQTCKRILEYRRIDRLDREFDLFEHADRFRSSIVSANVSSNPDGISCGSQFHIFERGGVPRMEWTEQSNKNSPWHPDDVLKFVCDEVIPGLQSSSVTGYTEHKRYDRDRNMQLLFRAHPSFKSDSGQLSNVWYDWAYFQLDLGDLGQQVYPCQILCFLSLKGPFANGNSVSGFEVQRDGLYAVVRRFLFTNSVSSKRCPRENCFNGLVIEGKLHDKLYLFDCNTIDSEAAVVRNFGTTDRFFVLSNRGEWLVNFRETMVSLEEKSITSIVDGLESDSAVA